VAIVFLEPFAEKAFATRLDFVALAPDLSGFVVLARTRRSINLLEGKLNLALSALFRESVGVIAMRVRAKEVRVAARGVLAEFEVLFEQPTNLSQGVFAPVGVTIGAACEQAVQIAVEAAIEEGHRGKRN
jgi:hypothetical protein